MLISLKPRSHRAHQRASTRQIKLMLKIVSIHTDRRASTNLHTSNEAIGLLITINGQNVRVAISLHHQTTPVLMTSLTMT